METFPVAYENSEATFGLKLLPYYKPKVASGRSPSETFLEYFVV